MYAPARLRRGPITAFTDIGTNRVAVDHVLPWALMTRAWQDGDLRQVWNLVLACYRCNSAKGARPPPTGCPG